MDISEEVTKIIDYLFGIRDVDKNINFIEEYYFDSLDKVELMMKLEEIFDIEMADEDISKINTIENTIDYIKNKLKKGE